MMLPRVLCRVWLACLALAASPVTLFGFQALDRAARQSPDDAPADPKDDRGTALSRRDMAKRLSTARRLIDEQRYAEAIAQIQRVLDNPQDEYCAVPGLRTREQSGKSLAEELLLSLPEEAQDIYEKQNGPAAQRLLEKTLKEFGNLDQVVDRYLHTRAGSQALYRQSVDAWERGQPLVAAQGFERLRQRGFELRELEPMLTLRTAAAWSQAGDLDRARRLFNEFEAINSGGNLQVGGQKLTVPKSGGLPVWLAQREGSAGRLHQEVSDNWLTWRGNSQRNGVGTGGGPYLNHGWRVETLASLARDTKEGRLVDILSELSDLARLDNEATPAISVGSPLVVGNLVIFRSLYNLRAVDRVTGTPVWTNAERDNDIFELLRPGPGGLPQSNQTMGTPAEYVVGQRLWSDINYNSISSDAERVYAVEDLGFVVPALPARIGPSQAIHNRLMAYDARSGRMLWEAGAPREPAGDALAGVFFLGAPVAWQGMLYAIVDLGSSPHLAVFQPKSGKLVVLQPLGTDEVELSWVDRARLTSGLTPSTDGGVLLCPTGPDSVTAYDPGRRRLMWRYRFRPRTEAPGPRGQLQLMQQQMARGSNRLPEQAGWIDYAGIIDSGRAIYSPKDSDELFCLNVNDGTLAWKAARGGGLYVGGIRDGVVLVVGRNFIQGLRLDDGRPAWNSPTMLPVVTGRGCLSDQSYLVPLASGEVAAVDVNDGRILSRAKSFAGHVPGSLVMAGGTIVSQRLDMVSGFRQVEALQAEIAAKLAVDPNHPESLTIRGQMRLERGEFGEALGDLERAVALAPDNLEARGLLLTALLEGLRTDFEKYHTFGPRAGELVGHGHERSQFHWLMAQGSERLGDRQAAFSHLLSFSDPEVVDRELERVQTSVLIRRDRQVMVAAERILKEATDAERPLLLEKLNTAIGRALGSTDPLAGARFLRYFGNLLPNLASATLTNVASLGQSHWLDAELEIQRALKSADARTSARLMVEWGEMLARTEKPRELAVLADLVERDYAQVELQPGGETVGQRAATWRERPGLKRRATARHDWATGKVETERLPGVRPAFIGRTQPIQFDGPRGPFLSGVTLELGTGDQQLVARDGSGKTLWKLSLDTQIWTGNAQFNRAWVRDHLLLLLVGKDLLAVDLLGSPDDPGPRWLWHQTLIEGSAAIMVQRGLPPPRARINFAPLGPDNTAVVGPATFDHLVVLRGRRLSALDPVTGQTIWMREGVPAGAGLFGDDDYLFVVPPDAHEALVYGMRDGSDAKLPDGTPVGSKRLPPSNWWLEPQGRHLVLWGKPLDKQVLALRDILSNQDVWSREFPVGAFVALVESEEALVLDPTGRVTCLSLKDGSIRFESEVTPQPNTNELQVLRTRDQYLVIANEPLPNGPSIVRNQQNVHLTVNGVVHALDRASGKRLWSSEMTKQQIDPQQPSEIPLVTFASHIFEPRRTGNGLEQKFLLTSLDRRTGRLLYEESRGDEPLHFIDYRIDEDASTIELQLFQSVIRFTFTAKSSTP